MPNNEMLLEIMDLIEHPEKMPAGTKWDQHEWVKQLVTYTIDEEGKDRVSVCGTSFCFAGWAVYLDGYTEYVSPVPDKNGFTWNEGSLRHPETQETLDVVAIQNHATHLLDIEDTDADALFEAGNSKEDLRNCVDALVRGESLAEVWPDDEEDE